jgi:predicted metal-dependent HD superfamily phosphohydrolase
MYILYLVSCILYRHGRLQVLQLRVAKHRTIFLADRVRSQRCESSFRMNNVDKCRECSWEGRGVC